MVSSPFLFLYMDYTIVNMENWERKAIYDFYKDYDDPFFSLTLLLDVTSLVDYCKQKQISIFLAKLHLFTKAANHFDFFKRRIVDNSLIEYKTIHTGSTILPKGSETFQFAYFDYHEDLISFCLRASDVIKAVSEGKGLDPADDRHDLIHFSSIPWIHFSSVKHARRFAHKDSIPKIVFGKIQDSEFASSLPVSIEVHHSLMDALHIAKYLDHINALIEDL